MPSGAEAVDEMSVPATASAAWSAWVRCQAGPHADLLEVGGAPVGVQLRGDVLPGAPVAPRCPAYAGRTRRCA